MLRRFIGFAVALFVTIFVSTAEARVICNAASSSGTLLAEASGKGGMLLLAAYKEYIGLLVHLEKPTPDPKEASKSGMASVKLLRMAQESLETATKQLPDWVNTKLAEIDSGVVARMARVRETSAIMLSVSNSIKEKDPTALLALCSMRMDKLASLTSEVSAELERARVDKIPLDTVYLLISEWNNMMVTGRAVSASFALISEPSRQ